MIPDIPIVGGESIPYIQVNGTGVKLIQTIRPTNTTIRPIGVGDIGDIADAGDFDFFCAPHAGAGMKGVIHVQ